MNDLTLEGVLAMNTVSSFADKIVKGGKVTRSRAFSEAQTAREVVVQEAVILRARRYPRIVFCFFVAINFSIGPLIACAFWLLPLGSFLGPKGSAIAVFQIVLSLIVSLALAAVFWGRQGRARRLGPYAIFEPDGSVRLRGHVLENYMCVYGRGIRIFTNTVMPTYLGQLCILDSSMNVFVVCHCTTSECNQLLRQLQDNGCVVDMELKMYHEPWPDSDVFL